MNRTIRDVNAEIAEVKAEIRDIKALLSQENDIELKRQYAKTLAGLQEEKLKLMDKLERLETDERKEIASQGNQVIQHTVFGETKGSARQDINESGGATITQAQFASLMTKVDSIQALVPVVYKISIGKNNLWTPSKINGKRSADYRVALMKEMGYTNKKGKQPMCMISGIRAAGDKVVCGHIVPCGSELGKLKYLGITLEDLNLPRNCVFWCIGFERAYETLQISFVKSHPMQDKLYLKFWNETVKTQPIWKDAPQTLGEFDGMELKLSNHVIMRRGLSYQAYQAYLNNSEDDRDVELTCMYGTPGTYRFSTQGTLMEQQYLKDIENETEDMEEV